MSNYINIGFNDLTYAQQTIIEKEISERLMAQGVLDDDLPDAVDNEIAKIHWELEY